MTNEKTLDRAYNTLLRNRAKNVWLKEEIRQQAEYSNKLDAEEFILNAALYTQNLIQMENVRKNNVL